MVDLRNLLMMKLEYLSMLMMMYNWQKFHFMLTHYNQFDSQKIISKVKDRFSKETVKKLYGEFYKKALGDD